MIDDNPLFLIIFILILFSFIIMIITLVQWLVQQIPISPDWKNYENITRNLTEWVL